MHKESETIEFKKFTAEVKAGRGHNVIKINWF